MYRLNIHKFPLLLIILPRENYCSRQNKLKKSNFRFGQMTAVATTHAGSVVTN